MSESPESRGRDVLPIPHRVPPHLTTYDAQDPATAFTGRIEWVQIDLDGAAEDADHLISDEERLRIAMARQ